MGTSCPDGEVSSSCLGHGANVETSFLHCTDLFVEQWRINVTFRWIKRHTASCVLRTGVVCCLPTCAQGSSASVSGNVGSGAFWALWVLLGVLCIWEVLALLVLPPPYLQDSGYEGVPTAGHALWAEFGGGILCVTLGEFSGLHKKMLGFFQGDGSDPICMVSFLLALAGQPSLHGYYACMG